MKFISHLKLYGIHTAHAQKQRLKSNVTTKMEQSNHVSEDLCNQLSKKKTIPSFLRRKDKSFWGKNDERFGSVLKEALEDLSIKRPAVHYQTSKGHAVHCIKHQRDLHALSAF